MSDPASELTDEQVEIFEQGYLAAGAIMAQHLRRLARDWDADHGDAEAPGPYDDLLREAGFHKPRHAEKNPRPTYHDLLRGDDGLTARLCRAVGLDPNEIQGFRLTVLGGEFPKLEVLHLPPHTDINGHMADPWSAPLATVAATYRLHPVDPPADAQPSPQVITPGVSWPLPQLADRGDCLCGHGVTSHNSPPPACHVMACACLGYRPEPKDADQLPYYTLTSSDVGKISICAFDHVWSISHLRLNDPAGWITEADIGRRVFLDADGARLRLETDQERTDRLAKDTPPHDD